MIRWIGRLVQSYVHVSSMKEYVTKCNCDNIYMRIANNLQLGFGSNVSTCNARAASISEKRGGIGIMF